MATEIQELIIQVKGEQDLKALTAAYDAEVEALNAAIAALGNVSTAQITANQSVQVLATNVLDLQERLDAARTVQRNFGMAALEASRAIEDLQYGIAGVLNNIPGFIAAIGGPAGAAAAVSLLAVAATQLYKHWDEILQIFGSSEVPVGKAITSLSVLQDRIKELSDKKAKVGVDFEELEAAKKAAQDLTEALKTAEDVRTGQARAERESGARIREAIAEAPGGGAAVVGALAAPREAEIRARAKADADKTLTEIEKGLEEARALEAKGLDMLPTIIDLENQRSRAQVKLAETLKGAATQAEIDVGKLIDAAVKGTGAAQERAQAELQRGLAGAGQGALAGQIGGLAPANIQGMEVQEQVRKQAEIRDREVKRAADAADRQDEQLTRQGEHQERMGREQEERADQQATTAEERARARDSAARTRAEKALQDSLARQAQQSGLMAQGQAYAANLMAQGATPERVTAELQTGFSRTIAAQRPDLNRLQRSALATRLTRETQQGLDQRLLTAQTQGLSSQQALLALGARHDAQIEMIQRAQTEILGRVQELNRRSQSRSRPANMGRNGGL